ncbi:hypothetical protein EON80_32560 [bacterium]|nr:MAG: hypothetical protein EON80_32560 [bacterium]
MLWQPTLASDLVQLREHERRQGTTTRANYSTLCCLTPTFFRSGLLLRRLSFYWYIYLLLYYNWSRCCFLSGCCGLFLSVTT